jgi:hypothetical protein
MQHLPQMEICSVQGGDDQKVRSDLVLISPTSAGGENFIEVIPPVSFYDIPCQRHSLPILLRKPGREIQERSVPSFHSPAEDVILNHRPPLTIPEGTTETELFPIWLPRRRDDLHDQIYEEYANPPLEYVVVHSVESGPTRTWNDSATSRPPLSPSPQDLLQVDQYLLSPSPVVNRTEGINLSPAEISRPIRMTTIDNAWKASNTVKYDSSNLLHRKDSMIFSEQSEDDSAYVQELDEAYYYESTSCRILEPPTNAPTLLEKSQSEGETEKLAGVQFLSVV